MKFVDTSVLIHAERNQDFREKLLQEEELFIPAMAAAEYLVGIKIVKSEKLRQRAQDFYDQLRPYVYDFDESQAHALAGIIATARKNGFTIKAFDAAIAAAAMDYDCPILVADGDFDGIDGLEIEKLSP
jgi:tRNA(fMet)-specific endonuclease VapC